MLKDILKKRLEKKEDKIRFPVMDGFVEIKGYDKNGKMFYHDCGDNVVTDWMRHVIISMLCGVSFGKEGSMPDKHDGISNPDGYLFNKKQFLDSNSSGEFYSKSTTENCKYAMFPTKVLFGTGKEYSSWDILKSENEETNRDWYDRMVELFGEGNGEPEAEQTFDDLILNDPNNDFSGTLAPNVFSGEGDVQRCRTIEDPDSSTTNISTSTSMYKNYNVIGAVKTSCDGLNNQEYLQETVSDSGRLLRPKYLGVGNPCFIYFDKAEFLDGYTQEKWQSDQADIKLSKNEDNKYLTKITFNIRMPAQIEETQSLGDYYPYNGYKLKQIGLYNDAKIRNRPDDNDLSYARKNMKRGTLLAVKNIAPITKTAEASYEISWTLTI